LRARKDRGERLYAAWRGRIVLANVKYAHAAARQAGRLPLSDRVATLRRSEVSSSSSMASF
jgi:hypothetical protein